MERESESEIKWTDKTFSRDDLLHAFIAGMKYSKAGIDDDIVDFNEWFKRYLKQKNHG